MSKTEAPSSTCYRRTLLVIFALSLFILAVGIVGVIIPDIEALQAVPAYIFALIYGLAILTASVGGILCGRHRRTNQEVAFTALTQQLSQVANKSGIVINAIGEGVIALDSAGTIDLINPAAQSIMGWEKQDALGLDYRSVFKLYNDKDELVETGGPIQQVLNGGDSVARSDLLLTTGSGKKINVWLQVSSVGKFGNGAIVVFRNITNEIAENRQRTEFVSTASHEMRTPVAAIEGYLGLALNPATAQVDDKARAYITKAHESAQHLGRLFQDLLDVSTAEDGRLKNEPQVIEIVDFVREAVSIVATKALERNLTLTFAPDVKDHENTITPICYAYVDPDHLREVTSNLIDNAIKYTKQGTVTIDVAPTEDKILLSFHDSGIGIAREDVPHLFQKFYRIDNSDTREIGGTGLGLYLCRRLVESMDGRIWVESEQGKGSTFNVELNRLSADKVRDIQNAQQSPTPQA